MGKPDWIIDELSIPRPRKWVVGVRQAKDKGSASLRKSRQVSNVKKKKKLFVKRHEQRKRNKDIKAGKMHMRERKREKVYIRQQV